jgi:uncharacterized protein YodC (DUF2158 family)
MATEQLREGDVVRLKSGGPAMTIVGYEEDKGVKCKWFDGNKVQEDWFPMYSIVKVPDEPYS